MYNTHWVVLYLRISNITKKLKKKIKRKERVILYCCKS